MFAQAFDLAGHDIARYACALRDRAHLAWLDGAARQGAAGRLSFLACDPIETRRDSHDWAALRATLNAFDATGGDSRVPRWVGYVAYDATFLRGDVHAQVHPRSEHPVLWFARYDAWLALDHVTQRAQLVGDDRDACDRLRDKLMRPPQPVSARLGDVHSSDAQQHVDAIASALDHIARGDLYQVNLARSFKAAIDGDALALYLAMRAQGDVPLGVYIDAGDHQVLCRSMETFLDWQRAERVLQTRPIKGTIARDGHHDEHDAAHLRNDAKERAEHTMIVDLMRNDLGRIAEIGSVRPVDVMYVEPYAGLSHLVSTVRCTTRAEIRLADVFDATFPPGSITGTPKLAAISAIERLEAEARGIYCGAIGHVDQAGGCNFAVAIRTAVVRDGVATYFAGGGIVEGSVATRELAETELKARVFVDAVAKQRADKSAKSDL